MMKKVFGYILYVFNVFLLLGIFRCIKFIYKKSGTASTTYMIGLILGLIGFGALIFLLFKVARKLTKKNDCGCKESNAE